MNCLICMDDISPEPVPFVFSCGHSICSECYDLQSQEQKEQCMLCKTQKSKTKNQAYSDLHRTLGFCTECNFLIDPKYLPMSFDCGKLRRLSFAPG